jgi:hypothetical protein
MVDLGVSAKSPGVVSTIERHLRLAGDALLDLNLWAGVVVGPEILLFFRCASRWRSARFKLGRISHDTWETISTAVEVMPFLETLHIRQHHSSSTDIDITFFKSYPRLTNISSDVDLLNPLSSDISWDQLTTIHFFQANTEIVYTILNLCRNLLSLSLRLPSVFHLQPEQEAPHVRVFNLRTLYITTRTVRQRNPFQVVFTIFSGVTLPALTDLSIMPNMRRSLCAFGEPRFEQGMWPQAAVVAMPMRSASSVSSLHLEGIPFETKAALQLLALVPNAIEVSLHESMPMSMDSLSESECALWMAISLLTCSSLRNCCAR